VKQSAFVLICCMTLLVSANTFAQGKQDNQDKQKPAAKKNAKAAKAKATPKPAARPSKSLKIKKAPFRITVALSGYLESAQMAEVSLKPEVWAAFKVLKAVSQGTKVKKGQVLVQLDTKDITEAIDAAERAAILSKLEIELAEHDLQYAEQLLPMDLARAERTNQQAAEDLKYYLDVSEPLRRKSAEFSIRSSENYLAYALEELKQLERMYKADDLTEETEEIILKRQRDSVERSKFNLERTRVENTHALKVTIPRATIAARENAVRAKKAWELAQSTLSLKVDQKRLTLAKMKRAKEKAAEKLAKLKKDLDAMAVKAPIAGIVYYGKPSFGQFTSAPPVAPRLKRDGSLKAREVFMTVVNPRPLQVRVTVPENQVRYLAGDMKGKATTTAFPDSQLKAMVMAVSNIPVSPGKFEARISIFPHDDDQNAGRILPGLACGIKVTAYENKDAIAVPSASVFKDGDQRVVYLKTEDGKGRKRTVKAGKNFGGKTEILDGLIAGDQILLSKP